MDLIKKLQEIEQHFNEISVGEFEEKLNNAGYGIIEHSNKSQVKMITSEELRQINDEITYSTKVSYKFDNLPNKIIEPKTDSLLLLVAS